MKVKPDIKNLRSKSDVASEAAQGERSMTSLDNEIAVFEKMQGELEASYMGKWVIIHDGNFIGAFKSLEAAAARWGAD